MSSERKRPASRERLAKAQQSDRRRTTRNIEGEGVGRIGASPSLRLEIHRDSVDAVAQMGRGRPVVEDVAKMAAAVCAMNLGSDFMSAIRLIDGIDKPSQSVERIGQA